jgi:hypothetical protein
VDTCAQHVANSTITAQAGMLDPSQAAGNELHCWTVLGQGPLPKGFNAMPEGVEIIDLCAPDSKFEKRNGHIQRREVKP